MRSVIFAFLLVFVGPVSANAAEPSLRPLVPEDIYALAGPQAVVASPRDESAAVIWRSIDPVTKAEQFALWHVAGDPSQAKPLEVDGADARSAVFSPDGEWLAIRSTRALPVGTPPIPPTPPQSDVAADIWLVSADGQRTLPLAGADKPYGRVFTDSFYGRVAFSPDGKRLAFVADDGRDPRSSEEIEAGVYVARSDQGEGYTGYGEAQIWVADLAENPETVAATSIRRLTSDDVWYGDPQWTPDSQSLIVHANKSSDVESVRFSINKNYDLWAIDVAAGHQRRLTFGSGPEVSPRIAPGGKSLVCLSSPRKGPHADVFNLLRVSLDGPANAQPESRVLFDHHAEKSEPRPLAIPSFPLPDNCWDGEDAILYSAAAGVESKSFHVNLSTNLASDTAVIPKVDPGSLSPALRQLSLQRKLSLPGNRVLSERLTAEDRVVKWQNEELELEGVLTLPPAEVAQLPYPLVVYPHGGPHSRSTQGFSQTSHIFAHAGYAVFQPNFRGSAGYGREFLDADNKDLGGGDMRDLLSGIDMLVKERLVDPRRQFVYGVSYGGYMTTWLVGHTRQFRAAVAQNAVTDMNVMWGLSDLQSWTRHELGGQPWEIADAMQQHSPIAFVDRVQTPTLILHSRDDRRCPIAMGRMFHQSLLARGVPTAMVEYPDEGHGIKQPKHQVDVLKRTLAWFAAHDVGAPVEIITLGDSITKGVRPGVKPDETFAAVLEKQLKEKDIAAKVTNVGQGGERTDQALARLEKDVIARKPRIVTIMYGTNDSWIDQGKTEPRLSLDEFRDNTVQLVERLRRAGITPILMTEPSHGKKSAVNGIGEHPNVRLEKYVAATREVAKELNVAFVDHFADWIVAESKGQDLTEWTTDQYHPNPAGHAHMATLMLPAILVEIKKHQP